MKLTGKKVTSVFMDCLFKDGEDTSNYVKTEGIITNVGLHPERLASHKTEILEMLNELPDEFKRSGGGGWSFLNACNDKDGKLWTGDQSVVEQLVLLGIASEKVAFQLPREVWAALPGGVPYFVVEI